ncbi:MAG: 30S ribosomal protein S3 [Candidatus Gottesmanbacteria bacterium GW2011_GWA2_47_9]|uniref:Small ribosomal subunit protein uS3 n=1 Tax=Candidatus Gottesmanbacteria bacterium GW2011_GWA2_47_9 TaxID=1618445 RepID=A0A0G1WD61_9BACT|nr:MAG: 30S ribosomal protein S3 [Candidatus Gottesmanbacteria bacterium GW2011_GWA2_47_9]
MGQKINPKGFRIGPVFGWESRWFADDRRYKEFFMVDVKLREVLFEKLKNAGLAQVEIERSINKIKVTLHVARPGVVIGRGGSGLEDLKKSIEKFMTSIDKKKDLQGRAGHGGRSQRRQNTFSRQNCRCRNSPS